MKRNFFLILLACFSLQSCLRFDSPDRDWEPIKSAFEPIHLSRAELNNSIQLKPAKSILNSGKIYIVKNLLFVNEKLEGFHIFDNSNPENPKKIKFLEVPGASDLAIRDSILYINQATDLITLQFDLTTQTVQLTKRIKNTFPKLLSPDNFFANNIPEDNIVINWTPIN